MRSQLLCMDIGFALLLTHDPDFERIVTEALKETATEILVTHGVDEALQAGCRRINELDLVLIDRSDCHAITLLSALRTCRPDLPVIVVAGTDNHHCAALAYASGAAACLAKPISVPDFKLALLNLFEPTLKLAAA